MKYKTGDRVESKVFGKGTVVEIGTGPTKTNILVQFDNENKRLHSGSVFCKEKYEKNKCYLYSQDTCVLKLIESKQFTKSDLKDEDIVTYRNGNKRIKIAGKLFDENGSATIWLHSYNEDLTRKYKERKETDIIKVERPTQYETVFERKEILDKAEKEYLSYVIRPFRNIVRDITKVSTQGKHYISIDTINDSSIDFPVFEIGAMYKNMEVGRLYSLEELEL